MTNEEKARAYDEAKERMRAFLKEWENCGAYGEAMEKARNVFPELAESEDEKARKWIYEYIHNCPNESFEFYGGVGKQAVLDYLEKQKENTWSEEDDEKVKVMCKEGDLKPSERAWLKDLRNRVWKEQKPAEINEYEIIKKHITHDSLSSEVNKRLKECGWYVTEEPVE